VPQALPIVDSLADPEIELIINLTTPDVHGEVGLAALRVDPENQLIEPLTDRELEVLRLMAEGLKYDENGKRLYISLNTVRYHVKSNYGKLSVNDRTKAIERGERLGVL